MIDRIDKNSIFVINEDNSPVPFRVRATLGDRLYQPRYVYKGTAAELDATRRVVAENKDLGDQGFRFAVGPSVDLILAFDKGVLKFRENACEVWCSQPFMYREGDSI